MTNREYIISQLSDKDCVDDDGASYESMIYYSIACPYFTGDDRGFCMSDLEDIKDCDMDLCFRCKENWLDSEVKE